MSAPTAINALKAVIVALELDGDEHGLVPDLGDALDDVTELVEADFNLDEAGLSLKRAARCAGKERARRYNRVCRALERRASALARFQPVAKSR